MANLLPSSERIALQRERWQRIVVAWCVLIAGVFLGGTILLMPSFVVTRAAQSSGRDRLETTRQLLARQETADAVTRLEALRAKVDVIESIQENSSVSKLLAQIIDVLPAGVGIDSFSWRSEADNDLIDISGAAATRDALIALGDQLKASGLFRDVTIPVESLAPQRDLRFHLTLSVPHTQPTP